MSFIIGIIGMSCILIGFILDEFWKNFNQDTYFYNILNLIGAGLLIWYAVSLNSVPFIILNVVWVVAAVVKLIKISVK